MTTYKLFYLKDFEYDYDDELKSIINNYHDKDIVIKVGETENIKNEWNIIKNLRKFGGKIKKTQKSHKKNKKSYKKHKKSHKKHH